MTKILVIEDEALLREDILEALTFEGYEAIGAADGVEGVNEAVLHEPDLILCDINMPRLDGYGVLSDLQANSTTRLTPFIFLTAKADPGDIRTGMQLGADDYLTKPFDRLDLLRTIQTKLDKKTVADNEYQQQVELFKDVLTHERTQRLLQTKLVALFSHDFRDALNAIRLTSSLLRDFVQNSDKSRSLEHINRMEVYFSQVLHMLDDLLLLAQMETDTFILKPEPVNVAAFLQPLVDEFQTIHRTTHQIVFESQFTDTARIDVRLLRPIAANLISNAIKYAPPGSLVHVIVSQREGQCVLIVKDQGVGIPEADQPHLFNAFERDSPTGTVSGVGLGLALVKQAVEAHDGTVTCESRVGIGTTFIVRLGIVESRHQPA